MTSVGAAPAARFAASASPACAPSSSPPGACVSAASPFMSNRAFVSASHAAPTCSLPRPPAYDALVKLLVIGDSVERTAVGKSCLLLRFCDDEFTPSFIATIGLDHKSKIVRLEETGAAASRTVKIQVWDTAGQEQYKTMTSNFYRSAMGVAIVYDVTYRRSFDNITNWLKNVADHASEGIVKVLVGNKCDIEGSRVVSYAEGQSLASQHGLSFLETSAKANINVDRLFVELARQCLGKPGDGEVGGSRASSSAKRRSHLTDKPVDLLSAASSAVNSKFSKCCS